jgi:hypothetical protein
LVSRRIGDYIDVANRDGDGGPIERPFQFEIILSREIAGTLALK